MQDTRAQARKGLGETEFCLLPQPWGLSRRHGLCSLPNLISCLCPMAPHMSNRTYKHM